MNENYLRSADEGLSLLLESGASTRLIEHHRLVIRTARDLLNDLPVTIRSLLNINLILVGCSIHDCGKIWIPSEEIESGNIHEQAGKDLLLFFRLPEEIARFCMIHSNDIHNLTVEELFVGISDNLSRGSRDINKELELVYRLHYNYGLDYLETLTVLDDLIDKLANRAHSKFLREATVRM